MSVCVCECVSVCVCVCMRVCEAVVDSVHCRVLLRFLARSGLMKTDVTVDDSHRTDSKDTKSKSCP